MIGLITFVVFVLPALLIGFAGIMYEELIVNERKFLRALAIAAVWLLIGVFLGFLPELTP